MFLTAGYGPCQICGLYLLFLPPSIFLAVSINMFRKNVPFRLQVLADKNVTIQPLKRNVILRKATIG